MKERPILFSAPMVRAILSGTKTVTRRILNPQPHRVGKRRLNCAEPGKTPVVVTQLPGWEWRSTYVADGGDFADALRWHSPYGVPGDRLWVKETHAFGPIVNDPDDWRDNPDDWAVSYRADGDERPWKTSHDEDAEEIKPPWRPSIFMPRWASRITLEVVSVRVERLHDITEDDARAEGVERDTEPCDHTRLSCEEIGCMGPTYRSTFAELWGSINGERAPWASNPWVWRVEFKRVEVKP